MSAMNRVINLSRCVKLFIFTYAILYVFSATFDYSKVNFGSLFSSVHASVKLLTLREIKVKMDNKEQILDTLCLSYPSILGYAQPSIYRIDHHKNHKETLYDTFICFQIYSWA